MEGFYKMTMTADAPTMTADDDRARVHTLSFSAAQIASLASVAVATSSDDVTPILGAVRLEVEPGGAITATATDRYRVARVTLAAPKRDPFDVAASAGDDDAPAFPGVSIPASLLTAFAKAIKPATKGSSVTIPDAVTLTLEPGTDDYSAARVTLRHTWGGVSLSEFEIRGNYPPVGRLLPDGPGDTDKLGSVELLALNLALLADAAKILLPDEVTTTPSKLKNRAHQLRFLKSDNPAKPGPVYIHRSSGDDSAEYMLQPNLRVR